MKILHLIRSVSDARALATARAHAQRHEVSLLLVHDAVLEEIAFAGPVFACKDDVVARNCGTSCQLVDYDEMVELIFAHERVISW